MNLRIVKQTQQDLFESRILLCSFDRIFSRDRVVHMHNLRTIRQPTVKFDSLMTFGKAYGRRKLSAIFEVNVQEKWKRHRFACLTINFDDTDWILDIFFIKAVCPDYEQVGPQ